MALKELFKVNLLIALCGIGLTLPLPAFAADEQGKYYDFGKVSCRDFRHDMIQPLRSNRRAANMLYIAGWLSAYNAYMPQTYNILGKHDMETIVVWLDAYCKSRPTATMQDGLMEILASLQESRYSHYQVEQLRPY